MCCRPCSYHILFRKLALLWVNCNSKPSFKCARLANKIETDTNYTFYVNCSEIWYASLHTTCMRRFSFAKQSTLEMIMFQNVLFVSLVFFLFAKSLEFLFNRFERMNACWVLEIYSFQQHLTSQLHYWAGIKQRTQIIGFIFITFLSLTWKFLEINLCQSKCKRNMISFLIYTLKKMKEKKVHLT